MNPKCFLTKSGNILVACTNGKYCFLNPSLEFIREVSQSEGEYLSDMCLEIEFNVQIHSQVTKYLLGLEFPTWHFIKSILVVEDYSNYKWETCNNGGNYSFQTYHDWYVAKYPDGKWKFAFVERHTTSAEFSYDELAGSFQNDLGCLNISNIMGEPMSYQCQQAKWWDGEEVHYYSEEVLEKIAIVSSFEGMWNEMYYYIPSKWDEEEYTDPANQCSALSFTNKKEIISRLKKLGVTRQDKKPSVRGGRKGGRR